MDRSGLWPARRGPDRVTAGEPLRFGRFTVTAELSRHSPPAAFPGIIDRPIHPPVRVSAYRVAECYSIVIGHDGPGGHRRLLVHASANFIPGMLSGHQAEVAYLGIGRLGKQDSGFRNQYWNETVVATGARAIIPVHWDDFTKSMRGPLVPQPYLTDDFDSSWTFLRDHCGQQGVSLCLQRGWQRTDPWAQLPVSVR